MMLGASRKYSCMNPVGRRCVHARPDFSRCSSISLCIKPNGNVVSRRASKPENLITWRTPAALPASINVFCVSTISIRGAEIMRTRSTPSRADPKLLGLDMSPSMICTVGAFSSPLAFALLRTKIRTGTRSRTNSSVMNEPARPVAPVRRIIAISLRFHSPSGSGPRRLSIGLRTQDVWSRKIESPPARSCRLGVIFDRSDQSCPPGHVKKEGFLAKQLYVVFTTPTKGIEPVMKVVKEHLEFQVALEKQGIMFAAGPNWTDDEKSWEGDGMAVIRAKSLAEASANARSLEPGNHLLRPCRVRAGLCARFAAVSLRRLAARYRPRKS